MSSSIKAIVLLALTLVVVQSSLFVVSEFERGIKLRFGELIEGDIQPGLHVKMPFVDNVRIFDARVLTVDAQPASFFTVEKKRLIVDSYAKWRIANVEAYYTKTGGVESVAKNRLANRVNDGLRNQFGTRTLNEVVSGERDLLMKNITEDLNSTVLEELGIEVVDVRVKRIDLPQDVSSQVFRRMTAEREKEARELRSTGKEKAEKILKEHQKQEHDHNHDHDNKEEKKAETKKAAVKKDAVKKDAVKPKTAKSKETKVKKVSKK